MKKFISIIIFLFILNNQVLSMTLSQALSVTYNNNLELNAERENLKVSKEDINISRSEFLPSVTLSGSKSQEHTEKLTDRSGSSSSFTDVDPETKSIVIEQTLFKGFAGIAEIQKSKIGLNLAEAELLKKEQEILYTAIDAYLSLIFANEKLKINQENLSLLERQVETDQVRLERGQITLSDLSQSESSLAGAQANFIQAKNKTITAKLEYEKVIGPINNIESLDKKLDIKFQIPKNLNSAIKISEISNPNLIVSKLEYEQSVKDVTIAKADLSPTAKLSYNSSKTNDFSSSFDEKDKESITATISIPIFKGGENMASLNRSKNLKNKKKLLFDNAIKTNKTLVASAWSNLQSSKSFLNSVKLQVKAAEIANEGIIVEYESGLGRSTLDVIQSNSILLNSKVTLAESQKNYHLSQFNLLKSVGLLNKEYLKFQ
tara:strand:- start:599 stop:1897 length:1299 start_codon:yes stop_codon:yes gene_type:complete